MKHLIHKLVMSVLNFFTRRTQKMIKNCNLKMRALAAEIVLLEEGKQKLILALKKHRKIIKDLNTKYAKSQMEKK